MRKFLVLGALYGLVAVAAGAVGAHALGPMLAASGGETRFALATDYLLFHALALIAVALLADRFAGGGFEIPGWLFATGAALFCGSLFVRSLTGAGTILTPAGGVLLIAGWVTLLVQGARLKS